MGPYSGLKSGCKYFTYVYTHSMIKLSVTCGRSVVFSGHFGFLHDIAEILLKVVLSNIARTLFDEQI